MNVIPFSEGDELGSRAGFRRISTPFQTSEKMSTSRFLAIVALERPVQLDAESIKKELILQFPDSSEKIQAASGNTGVGFAIKYGEHLLTVMNFDIPVISGTFDRAVRDNLIWPQAGEVLARHRAHVVVGSVNEGKTLKERLDIAASVARVSAAISSVAPTLGVYWSSSEIVFDARRFRASTAGKEEGESPINFLVRLHLFTGESRGASTAIGCATTGLMALVGREVEFTPAFLTPVTVAERVLGTVHYILADQSPLKHGDSIGISAAEHIRVEHLESGLMGVPIFRLTYEKADNNG